MFSSYSRKFFRSLLLLSTLSLGAGAARAQEEAKQQQGEEPSAPAQVSSARADATELASAGREAATADDLAAARFGSPGTRLDYSNPVAIALQRGFRFESGDSVARFGVPSVQSPGTSSALSNLHAGATWQDPQGSPPPQQPQPNVPMPLTAGQKMERAFKRAFLSPVPYATSAFSAIITQLGEDDLPHKTTGDKVADGLSRMAINFGRSATRTIFTGGIYASLFKQDPRYDRSQGKSIGGKVLHAVSRVFVTRDDDWNLEPNYSRFAGNFTASGLSNAWERSTPGHDRIGWDATFRRFGRMFLNDAITNILFRELLPDIF